MERICANCALKTLKGGLCPVFNADMSNEKGCPMFSSEIVLCDVCGGVIVTGGTFQYDEDRGDYALLCTQCANASPCATCRYHSGCRFEKDTSCPEPLYIMVQHRQGNAIIQSQQLNPKRVQATCAQGCPCFWEDGLDDGNFCLGKIGCGCKTYKLNRRK
jgi:hypothetical protein